MTDDDVKFELAAGKALSPEEAERMLIRLQGHFGQPVKPVERYCDSLREWQRAMAKRAHDARAALYPGINDPDAMVRGEAYKLCHEETNDPTLISDAQRRSDVYELKRFDDISEQIAYVFLQILKSALLGRLIYGNEKIRSDKCPIHNGEWSGLEGVDNVCPHGCELTGWVRGT